MQALYYPQFIRINGAREGKELTVAPINETLGIALPKQTVLHYHSGAMANIGITGNHPFLINWPTSVRVHFVMEAEFKYGSGTKTKTNITTLVRDYFKRQKGVKRSRNLERDIIDERDMLVMDYTALNHLFNYRTTPTIYQDRFKNLAESFIASIKQVGTNRPQFVMIQFPNTWVEETRFKTALDGISSEHRDDFQDVNMQWLLELYRYVAQMPSILDGLVEEQVTFALTNGLKTAFLPIETLNYFRDNDSQGKRKLFDFFERILRETAAEDITTKELEAVVEGQPSAAEQEEINRIVPAGLQAQMSDLIAAGRMSGAQQQRMGKIIVDAYMQDSPFPELPNMSLQEAATITEEDITLPSTEAVTPVNEDMVPADAKNNRLTVYKTEYAKKLMAKDTASIFTSLTNGGVIVTKVEVREDVDALEEKRVYTLTLMTVHGKQTTFDVAMPIVKEDGTFSVKGVTYTLDAQKADLPFRKVNRTRSAITSYAGKLFFERSKLKKNDYSYWLGSRIGQTAKNPADSRVEQLKYTTQSIPNIDLPRDYTALMGKFSSFKGGKYFFDFRYTRRKEIYGENVVRTLERDGGVVCGTYQGKPMVMAMNGVLSTGDDFSVESILVALGGNWGKVPVDIAVFNSKGRRMPCILFLGYILGLNGLIKKLKTKVRWEGVDKRANAQPKELVINFNNERMYVDISDPFQAIVWQGLKDIEQVTKRLESQDLNKKGGWVSILPFYGANSYHVITWQLMTDMFLDPMTIDVLKLMGEPTNFVDLFIRAIDVLKTDASPDEADPRFMRIRGLERINGMLYALLYEEILIQRRSLNPARTGISLPPYAMDTRIIADTSLQMVQHINVVQTLKEQEALTLAGEGGRSSRTLVKRNRIYHKNDVGVVSEGGTDSSKIGIRSFMSPNAHIDNMRGMTSNWQKEDGSSSLLSTTSLLMPDMDRDDGKRLLLAGAQQSAVVPCVGYELAAYRTGYEAITASRVGEYYVFIARKDGTVSRVNPDIMEVTYVDESKEGYRLGVKHGKFSGEVIAHSYVTDVIAGHKFKAGDVLAWNSGFFTRDLFSPMNVVQLMGMTATVALTEGNDTLEDGSAVAERMLKRLETKASKEIGILIESTQEVRNLVKVGDETSFNTKLMTIEEGALAGQEETDAALLALSRLADKNPKAKKAGKVTRIEVFYRGEIDSFSPSLQEIIKADNKRRKAEVTTLNRGKAGLTGEVKKDVFIAGEKLLEGTVMVVIYIDYAVASGIGDKDVLGNQLKTIHGRVLSGVNRTESGIDIDYRFGGRSVNDRIVRSFVVQGVAIRVIEAMNKQLVENFFK